MQIEAARTVAPAESLLALADVKAHLHVDHDDDDGVIAGLVAAAEAWLDGVDGILSRALVTQTWAATASGFPADRRFMLPLAPVQSVTEVACLDEEGVTRVLEAEQYRLIAWRDTAFIELAEGAIWPTSAPRSDAVTITFVAGYGGAADVPASIRVAATMLIGQWYENREAMARSGYEALPIGVRALLAGYRRSGAML